MKRYSVLLASVLCIQSTTGCSLWMTPPPTMSPIIQTQGQNQNTGNSDCTSSPAAPITDAILATAAGVGTYFAVKSAADQGYFDAIGSSNGQGSATNAPGSDVAGTGILLGVAALIYMGSSYHGFRVATKCVSYHEDEKQAAIQMEVYRLKTAEENRIRDEKEESRLASEKIEKEKEDKIRQQKEEQEAADKLARARAACLVSYSSRMDSIKKYNHHQSVRLWVGGNCKVVPTIQTHNVCAVSTNGIVSCHDEQDQVGEHISCPTKNRPVKLDGSSISDADIVAQNFSTSNDTTIAWEKDVKETTEVCYQFDQEGKK